MEKVPMDWQTVFNLLGTGVLGLIGYFVKDIRDEQKAEAAARALLGEKFANFQVEVALGYVRNERLDKIEAALLRIEEKIDRKADK